MTDTQGAQYQRRYGAGGCGQIMVRGRDFRAIKLAIERARVESSEAGRERAIASRRARAKEGDGAADEQQGH